MIGSSEWSGAGGIEESAAWHRTADAILAGICHELNGRVGTISGLVQLARMDGELDDDIGGTLESEVARLVRLSGLLGLLARDPTPEEPEPVRPSELVPTALELLRRHRGAEGVVVDVDIGDDAPVVGGRAALLKSLVVLLAAAAQTAHRRRGRVRISTRRGANDLALVVEEVGEATDPDAEAVDVALAAARAALAPFEAEVEGIAADGGAGRAAFRLRLRVLDDGA